MEVPEASDMILVRCADEVPSPRLQDAADIGEGSLLAAESKKTPTRQSEHRARAEEGGYREGWLELLRVGRPGGRRGGREPGVAAVVEHPVDGERDFRPENGPGELRPYRGGPAAAGGDEGAPDRRVDRRGVLRRPRRGEVVGGDRVQGLVRRRGHALRVGARAAAGGATTG